MQDCVFCKMVQGEIKPQVILENDSFFTFLDQSPIQPGHTLVIPKKHTDYLFDIEDKEYADLMLEAKKVAKLLKEKMGTKRIGILVEGFGVAHAHVHLVPINNGGQVSLANAKHASMEELKEVAEKIRN